MTQLKRFAPDEEAESLGDLLDEDSEVGDSPGGLLAELERRQDAVLLQLEALNAEVEQVLKDLGVRLEDEAEAA